MLDWLQRHPVASFLAHLVLAAVLLVPLGLLLWHVRHGDDQFDTRCRADGGHVRLERRSVGMTDSQGRPYSDTETTRYCLDRHGTVLRTRH